MAPLAAICPNTRFAAGNDIGSSSPSKGALAGAAGEDWRQPPADGKLIHLSFPFRARGRKDQVAVQARASCLRRNVFRRSHQPTGARNAGYKGGYNRFALRVVLILFKQPSSLTNSRSLYCCLGWAVERDQYKGGSPPSDWQPLYRRVHFHAGFQGYLHRRHFCSTQA